MTRRAWLAAALVAVVAAGALGPAAGGAERKVRVAAHRGGARLWPENSLLAFRNAIGLGVDLVETDVHLTADGEAVLVHDGTLERTTTGQGPVSAITAADLARRRLKGADGTPTDEPVPTLAALLDLLAGRPVELLLEIKVRADQQRYPGIEEKVLDLLGARGALDRTWLMAFQPDTIRRVRELEPRARTVLLVARVQVDRLRARPADVVRWTRDAGASVLGVQYPALDARLMADARAAGLRVAAWTVNDEAELRRVIDLGADVVISDRPDVALRVAGRAH